MSDLEKLLLEQLKKQQAEAAKKIPRREALIHCGGVLTALAARLNSETENADLGAKVEKIAAELKIIFDDLNFRLQPIEVDGQLPC